MDISVIEINLVEPITCARLVPSDGRGALIGIIDSGFDLTHPSFLDAQGETRILAAWDQVNPGGSAGAPPLGFSYGVEYTSATIDQNVAAQRVMIVRNHEAAGAHGTYVAGIAAGNGTPDGLYKGIAPVADLILVTYRNDVPVGESPYVLDAIDYIRKLARALGRSVVINLSQGDNLGSHDGMSQLERAIDHVIEDGRVLVVVSAGNERGGPASHHAQGKVEQGCEFVLSFALSMDQDHVVDGDTIELWYSGRDRFAVALQAPGGKRSDFIEPDGMDVVIEFPPGNRAHVRSQSGHPTNGDNRIGIVFERGEGWETGPWQLILRGNKVERGDFDAWADRPNAVTIIDFRSHQCDASTITLPGNSRRAITVGGFISRPSSCDDNHKVKGNFASGSSTGPTRDGRVKPDLTAPGTLIRAPRVRRNGHSNSTHYDLMSGTSMAAPHVTGVVALLWSLWPGLTAGQIRDALLSTARNDAFTGVTPNTNWGQGKLDAKAAYEALSILVEKGEATMSATQVLEFESSFRENRYGEPAGMRIRIELGDNADLIITGTSTGAYDGQSYIGTLMLRKAISGYEGYEGGDECWVNGVWVSPCPSNETEGEESPNKGNTEPEA
jgi:subtilisin family serine protease